MMQINLKPIIPVACFLSWLFFVISCEKPEAPPVDPQNPQDSTVVVNPTDTTGNQTDTTITGPVDTMVVIPMDDAPVASFTFTNNNCTIGMAVCTVQFTNTSLYATSYVWKFGDNSTSTEVNPNHYFGTSGTYKVILTAYKNSQFDSDTQTVTINPPVIPNTIVYSGYQSGNGILQTSDDGYVIAGTSAVAGAGKNVCLIKTDASRNVIWEKYFGGSGNEEGNGICQTSDGGFIIAGTTDSEGAGLKDVYLIKTDGEGNLIWSKTYGSTIEEVGMAIASSVDGGFVITGWTGSYQSNSSDWVNVLVLKTDANGNALWQKTFDAADIGLAITSTSDGGCLVGTNYNTATVLSEHAHLIKLDAEGNLVWQKIGISDVFSIYSVRQTTDGGYILGASGFDNFGNQKSIYLVKTDNAGEVQWINGGHDYVNGVLYDEIRSVRQTSDGGYVLCGASDKSGYDSPLRKDVIVVKTDASGNKIWTRGYTAGARFGIGNDLQQTSDGGYIVVGNLQVEIANGNFNVYLLKLDGNGNLQ